MVQINKLKFKIGIKTKLKSKRDVFILQTYQIAILKFCLYEMN